MPAIFPRWCLRIEFTRSTVDVKPQIQAEQFDAVVVGTSAGGVEALLRILPRLHTGFPLPILTVIHLPPDARSGIADLFAMKCKLRVKEAEDKEPIEPGCIYFAPPNYHLLVEPDRRLSLSSDEAVMFSRPSIDVLFESAADVYGERLLAIVLTGASSDGAKGLSKICNAGGVGIVESPDSAHVPTMPISAMQACDNARQMNLSQIGDLLRQFESPSDKR